MNILFLLLLGISRNRFSIFVREYFLSTLPKKKYCACSQVHSKLLVVNAILKKKKYSRKSLFFRFFFVCTDCPKKGKIIIWSFFVKYYNLFARQERKTILKNLGL